MKTINKFLVAIISFVMIFNLVQVQPMTRAEEQYVPLDYKITASQGTVVPGDKLTYEVSPLMFDENENGNEKINSMMMTMITETVDGSRILQSIRLPKAIFTIDGEEYGVSYGFYDNEYAEKASTDFSIQKDEDVDYITITREHMEDRAGGKIPKGWHIYIRPLDHDGTWMGISNKFVEKVEMKGSMFVDTEIVPDAARTFDIAYPYFYIQQFYRLESETVTSKQPKFNRFGYSFFATYDVELEGSQKYIKPGEDAVITHKITNTGPYPITRATLDLVTDFEIDETEELAWKKTETGYTRLLRNEANAVLIIQPNETYTFSTTVKQKEGTKVGAVLKADTSLYTYGNANENKYVDEVEFVVSDKYNVSYDANGTIGTVPAGFEGMADESVIISDNTGNLEKENSKFVGWNTKADGTGTAILPNAEVFLKDLVSEEDYSTEIKLYAQFAENTFRVTYNGNESDDDALIPVDENEYHKGDKAVIIPQGELIKEGYEFLGWSKSPIYEDDEDFINAGDEIIVDGDTVFYAAWGRETVVRPTISSTSNDDSTTSTSTGTGTSTSGTDTSVGDSTSVGNSTTTAKSVEVTKDDGKTAPTTGERQTYVGYISLASLILVILLYFVKRKVVK